MRTLFQWGVAIALMPILAANAQYQVDFESTSVGTQHGISVWEGYGFPDVNWTDGEDRAKTVSSEFHTGSKSLEVEFVQGVSGPGSGGHQAPLEITPAQEYYASYWMKFSNDFSWGNVSQGGKLPGLGSEGLCSGGSTCTGSNGFTSRYMWRADGKAVVYLYHMDKPGTYGEDIEFKDAQDQLVYFPKGQWVNVIQRVKINTGSNHDGEMQVWFDGEEVISLSGLQFVSNGNLIDHFYFSTFHGGSGFNWGPVNDCEIYFDDLVVSTDPNDVFGTICNSPSLVDDFTLCPGVTEVLDAGLGNDYTYVWSRDGVPVGTNETLSISEPGVYSVSATSTECPDAVSDAVNVMEYDQLEVTGDTICSAGGAVLEAISTASAVSWFSSPDGETSLHEGEIYEPNITQNVTYYVEESDLVSYPVFGESTQAGTVWNTTNFDADDKRIQVTVNQELMIEALHVHVTNNNTDVVIRLLDDDISTVLQTSQADGVQSGKQRIEVGFSLMPGDYYLDMVGTSSNIGYQADGASFPYSIPGLIAFTYVESWQDTWYGFFYDWEVSSGSTGECRSEVNVVIDPQHSKCGVTSTHDVLKDDFLEVYPNPAVSELSVPNELIGQEFVIVDQIGASRSQGILAEKVDVSSLPAGHYVLSVGGQNIRFVVE